jgi:hypothetical protein
VDCKISFHYVLYSMAVNYFVLPLNMKFASLRLKKLRYTVFFVLPAIQHFSTRSQYLSAFNGIINYIKLLLYLASRFVTAVARALGIWKETNFFTSQKYFNFPNNVKALFERRPRLTILLLRKLFSTAKSM